MATVNLVNLKKQYGNKFEAVNGINLEIHDREFTVLVGPSGSGKSTILRMIAGLEDVTAGEIYINGRRVNEVLPKDRDIAMVFQDYALYPHMSVFDNIAFGLRMRNTNKDEINQRVTETAKVLGIQELLQRKPKQISGGEKQRVALGRAIVRNPQVFLMDEPLSNLDAKLRVQMRMEILRLYRKLNATIVYVTHDQTEAMTMGTRIVVLKDGAIQQVDTPRELYTHPANTFVASFIGTPSMNLIRGRVVKEEDSYYLQCTDGILPLPPGNDITRTLNHHFNTEVIIGIRPDHIYLATDEQRNNGGIIGRVELVEDLGADICASLITPCGNLLMKVPAETPLSQGDMLDLTFDWSRLHLFDPENEQRILVN